MRKHVPFMFFMSLYALLCFAASWELLVLKYESIGSYFPGRTSIIIVEFIAVTATSGISGLPNHLDVQVLSPEQYFEFHRLAGSAIDASPVMDCHELPGGWKQNCPYDLPSTRVEMFHHWRSRTFSWYLAEKMDENLSKILDNVYELRREAERG